MSPPDLRKDRLKLVSILVASDLGDEGLLREPQLFFKEVNTHTPDPKSERK